MDAVVVGGSGQVGSHIVKRLRADGYRTIGTYYSSPTPEASVQVDKTDESAVFDLISSADPDFVFDTAAFHDVDTCESQRDKAWSVNAMGTQNIAAAADEAGAHLIYLSTDYVFPGDPEQAPYTEGAAVDPLNYYGMSKYAGEQAVKVADCWTVVRSSVIYDWNGDNFFTWAYRKLNRSERIEVVDDQVGTPTYAPDIAEACLRIGKKGLTGLFHGGGPQSVSRYEFVRCLAESYGYDDIKITPISTGTLGQEAARPSDSSLDSTKLYRAVNYLFRNPKSAFDSMQLKQRNCPAGNSNPCGVVRRKK